MKYYLIAGEASGDMHAANLMKALQEKDSQAEFRFWGGAKMKAVGGYQVEDYRNTAFMGFWEVLTHLRSILRFLSLCKEDITQWKPDHIILIDYPGFNLRIAKWLHTNKERLSYKKLTYYIAPQVWAWKPKRAQTLRKTVDELLVILPFEEDWFAQHQTPATFVGHPLLDEIRDTIEPLNTFDKPVLALLPGSRSQEVNTMLPLFLKASKHLSKDYQRVVAGLSSLPKALYENHFTHHSDVALVEDKTYSLLAGAHAALVTSGTATLETGLFGVPMVVAYKGSWLSYQIGKRLVDIDFISLVNLIFKEGIVPEYIQNEAHPMALAKALDGICAGEERMRQKAKLATLKKWLGEAKASEQAASIILEED